MLLRGQPGLFWRFRAQPLINPLLSLLYDVFLCLLFRRKHAAASDDDIMEAEFFSKLNVGIAASDDLEKKQCNDQQTNHRGRIEKIFTH